MSRPISAALLHGLLIWLVGFLWGSVVFAIPPLMNLPSIAHVSRYPAISFPLLIAFAGLAWILAGRYFHRHAADTATANLYGLALAGVNAGLDLLILVAAFGNGIAFYDSLTLWSAYAVLYVVPRLRARPVLSVDN